MSPETKFSLHKKLAKVMYEVERIPKNGTAPPQMGSFKFVQVGDAADVIRKALAEQGVSMIPTAIELIDTSEHQTSGGKAMTTITVRTTWTLTDADTNETTVIQSLGSGADTGDKAAPKAQSNAMKYALLMGFLLSTGDDPEGEDSSDRQRPAQRQQQRPTPIRPSTTDVPQNPTDADLRALHGEPEDAPWDYAAFRAACKAAPRGRQPDLAGVVSTASKLFPTKGLELHEPKAWTLEDREWRQLAVALGVIAA